MKTATSGSSVRQLCVLSVAALGTVIACIGAPSSSSAQDSTTRTLATGSRIPLAENAPDKYTVKPGDTLWDISKVFLRDAWNWPEIWYLNPQVVNPHRIYPGDVLALVYVDGQPRVTLQERAAAASGTTRLSPRVREEPIDGSITAIPAEVIQAFAGRPTLLTKDQVKSAPYLVAMRDSHLIGGSGNEVYARGIKGANVDTRYSIIHVDAPMRDPENNDLLGYRALYVGAGPVVSQGDPAKLVLSETDREALRGDKLFPEDADVTLDFVPHAPQANVDGVIMAVSGVKIVGQYQVVAINRGSSQGLEPGHVLAGLKAGEVVRDHYAHAGVGSSLNPVNWTAGRRVRLPSERAGLIMVFKTYERMSYGLIMEATTPLSVGDRIGNP